VSHVHCRSTMQKGRACLTPPGAAAWTAGASLRSTCECVYAKRACFMMAAVAVLAAATCGLEDRATQSLRELVDGWMDVQGSVVRGHMKQRLCDGDENLLQGWTCGWCMMFMCGRVGNGLLVCCIYCC
jgi:hypothetical protein